jgi:D-alanyl-D-alanine carboxypeptidase/D-alanyl-D-alanine-endopeptidase (penicillin-binding protein 4)
LGDSSRVSSAQMMYALQALHSRLDLRVLLKPFHMRDEKRRIIKDHPIKVQAKTGTLNFVSGLAGFVDLPDGREIVFAIFVADLDRRAGLSRAERENPEGGRAWNIRAKKLQQALIERWAVLFAA